MLSSQPGSTTWRQRTVRCFVQYRTTTIPPVVTFMNVTPGSSADHPTPTQQTATRQPYRGKWGNPEYYIVINWFSSSSQPASVPSSSYTALHSVEPYRDGKFSSLQDKCVLWWVTEIQFRVLREGGVDGRGDTLCACLWLNWRNDALSEWNRTPMFLVAVLEM